MTLCIAAACQDHGKSRIVIATDWKVSIETATAEIQDKLCWIDDNTPVLIAGTISKAKELKDTFRNYFEYLKKENRALRASDLPDVMKRPIAVHKRKLANEHISLRLGLSYKEFRESVGRNEIPPDTAKEVMDEISAIGLDCTLIIVFFFEKDPYIYKVEEDGSLISCDNFATIGSGSPIAGGVLYQRQQESDMSLGRTIYHVYEAMKLGSIASDVGQEHTINVLYPQGEKEKTVSGDALTTKADRYLARQFKKLGPKKFAQMALPGGFFEEENF